VTGGDRTKVTGGDRTKVTGGDRTKVTQRHSRASGRYSTEASTTS
jgi:hypothetical protein